MKRLFTLLLSSVLLLSFTACGSKTIEQNVNSESIEQRQEAASPDTDALTESNESKETEAKAEQPDEEPQVSEIKLKIGDIDVTVDWEDNESVVALKETVKNAPLKIQMSMYGGFEQVGSLGTSLPRNDVQTTTKAGDIVLFSGSQIVVFYGSNSWSYTRLGRITDQSAQDMAELLGNGDVTITLSTE